MAIPTQIDDTVSKSKRKAIIKRIEDKLLITIDTHNKIFVGLCEGVVSYDNITAWRLFFFF